MPSVDLIRYWSKGCVGERANGRVGDAATMPLDRWGENPTSQGLRRGQIFEAGQKRRPGPRQSVAAAGLGAPMTWLLYQTLAPVLSRSGGMASLNNGANPHL
jgi:hypothetical protein